MPLHLETRDLTDELENVSSLLIVSCPVCPPVSLAIQRKAPLIRFFNSGLKTKAYEDYITEIRSSLEQRGIRTGVLAIYVPIPTMCLWTQGQRNRLLKRAKDYEAVLVFGCTSATYTVRQALKGTDCRVIQAMRTTGITNATVKFRFPLSLELQGKARVQQTEAVDCAAPTTSQPFNPAKLDRTDQARDR